jgi:hypothetical protein
MKESIIGRSQDEELRPVAHIVAFRRGQNDGTLIGQVALFGWMTYNVILSRGSSMSLSAGRGHIYSVKTKTVYPLKLRTMSMND